jgi:hypothetical protein
MITKDCIPVLQNYFTKNITRCYLHYNIKSATFECHNSVKLKSYLIPIMIATNFTTEYEVLYFTGMIKQKWNLYEYDEIPDDVLKKECNGCGNKQFGKIIPELVFHKCCNIHDYMYFLGGDRLNRKMSDSVFYYNMLRNSTKWWHKGVAFIYHYFVRHLGKDSFNYK